MRANVNIFYKCEKILSWPFLLFKRTEFQDLTQETVDETKPLSVKRYFARKDVLRSYNSKYLRGGVPKSQEVYFDAFDLTFRQRCEQLWFLIHSSLTKITLFRRKDKKQSVQKDLSTYPQVIHRELSTDEFDF
jgi:hypothetical protein